MAKRNESNDHELDESEQDELEGGAEGPDGDDAERDSSANQEDSDEEDSDEEDSDEEDSDEEDSAEGSDEDEAEAAALGAARYVHAAFFGAGILTAYLSGKLLLAGWNMLADWPEAVRQLPVLIQYGEEERATFTLLGGAIVGILTVLWYYRKQTVRDWANEVASELSRVTWPNRETVTNGTMVVLVASLVATVYVALLDRVWGYLTNLVYGA